MILKGDSFESLPPRVEVAILLLGEQICMNESAIKLRTRTLGGLVLNRLFTVRGEVCPSRATLN